VRGWSGRHALHRAALASAASVAAIAMLVGGATAADTLRAQARSLQEQRDALVGTEHGALLTAYAAEASLARARGEAAAHARRTAALEREERSVTRQAAVVRRSLRASQARVARTLRALYIAGSPEPLAVLLGAASLDEVVAGIETLRRATAQNRRLAREAHERAGELTLLRGRLRERRAAATLARDAATAAVDRLARAAASRQQTLDAIRNRAALVGRRLDALVARARAAERVSAELSAPASAPTAAAPMQAETTVTEPTGSVVPPAGESRTLVVDAVAYHLPGRTASGLPVGPGVVAVDPRLIPLGTRLFIPGYGPGIAADTGTAIKGRIIDLWMSSTADALGWGRRTVTITIYG
jgi:3D (Asp-Asp-Asp) domain-containing protein/septal ring factor EnvC (AmiA/AmiB activator)